MNVDLAQYCIGQDRSLREAVEQMDRLRRGIVLVVDGERRLLGTITDGDVRRAILTGVPLDEPVQRLLERKAGTPFASPITARAPAGREVLLKLLHKHSIRHLPVVNAQNRVVGLITSDDFMPDEPLLVRAVVMAGGVGKRLHPLTQDTPKPMLPVGNQPLLEIIIRQLRLAGIQQVKLSLHHQPEKIASYFGDGKEFGIDLSYITEDQPLGTAGSLGLMEPPTETTLVMNGDLLTQVDFRAMVAYHREHDGELTVAVRAEELRMPYGVVECDGPKLRGLREKPTVRVFVNAGIYLLEPSVYHLIPQGERFDMTDLIQRLLDERRPVVSFPIREYWQDIGEHEGYVQALKDIKTWR